MVAPLIIGFGALAKIVFQLPHKFNSFSATIKIIIRLCNKYLAKKLTLQYEGNQLRHSSVDLSMPSIRWSQSLNPMHTICAI